MSSSIHRASSFVEPRTPVIYGRECQRTEHIGTKHASVTQNHLHDPTFLQACIEQLALDDEQLLAAYVEGETITEGRVRTALRHQVGEAKLSPVFLAQLSLARA